MADIQQEVIIYKEGMSSAQKRFEKDLRKRQAQGWRVVSITPTKQTFNRISHLTVIYERSQPAKPESQPVKPESQPVKPESQPVKPESQPVKPESQPVEKENLLSGQAFHNIYDVPVSTPSDMFSSIDLAPELLPEKQNSDPIEASEQTPTQQQIPYSKAIFLCLTFLLIVSFGFPALFISILICVLVIDIKGYVSLAGLIQWREMNNTKRIGMGCLLCFLFPILFFIYFFRMGVSVFHSPGSIFTRQWDASQSIKRRATIGIIVGIIATVVFSASGFNSLAQTDASVTTTTPTPIVKQASNASLSGHSQTSKSVLVSKPSPIVKPTPTPAPKPTPRPTPMPKPKPTAITYAQFDDGTYIVGKDIQPGTYRTREASPSCYYARLSGFGGTIGDILANNNTDNPAIVTILATDKGFESMNCGTWTKDLSAITTSKTSFDDGMYIVGTDIQPGTYKNSGQSGCYYARLSGFGNTTDDIVANDNTDVQAIVTIDATDQGFQSNGCGTWTKQ